jgi:predicted porin
MNKKLIALAIAGACVAPEALAQTANPVTLYGRVYVNFESVESKGVAVLPRRNRVEDRVSLFGIRGTEDLGGGLKAFFQLETPFRPDQNDTVFASRNSAVGLQGGFGSILLGRWDSPMKITQTAVDPFGDIGLGDITAAASALRRASASACSTPCSGGRPAGAA